MAKVYRRHQKLPSLEAEWKWAYLARRLAEGYNITKYIEQSVCEVITEEFYTTKEDAAAVDKWIERHLNPDFAQKLDQTIRRKRKRYFDNETLASSKKMTELEYEAWDQLSSFAKKYQISLSEAVVRLVDLIDPKKEADFAEFRKRELEKAELEKAEEDVNDEDLIDLSDEDEE